jgi:hypothetical protein
VSRQFHRAARRRVALLGCLLVLFQALLFGWHHHALALAARGVPPAAHGASGAPLSPATAEDDCDICQVLHHLRTAPGEIASLPPPAGAASALALSGVVGQGRGASSAFQARAPPRV